MAGERKTARSSAGSPVAGHCQSIRRSPSGPAMMFSGTASPCRNALGPKAASVRPGRSSRRTCAPLLRQPASRRCPVSRIAAPPEATVRRPPGGGRRCSRASVAATSATSPLQRCPGRTCRQEPRHFLPWPTTSALARGRTGTRIQAPAPRRRGRSGKAGWSGRCTACIRGVGLCPKTAKADCCARRQARQTPVIRAPVPGSSGPAGHAREAGGIPVRDDACSWRQLRSARRLAGRKRRGPECLSGGRRRRLSIDAASRRFRRNAGAGTGLS